MRSPRLLSNILRGASSKKRKLSQIQQSPVNDRKRMTGASALNQKTSGAAREGVRLAKDTTLPARNPAIQLIPAITKKKQDNRASPAKQQDANQRNERAGPSRRETTYATRKSPSSPRKSQDFRSLPLSAP